MSIADHFDSTPDGGFIRSYDSQAARHQFQISVALILILTLIVPIGASSFPRLQSAARTRVAVERASDFLADLDGLRATESGSEEFLQHRKFLSRGGEISRSPQAIIRSRLNLN
jgi:hypothetical protein